MDFLLPKSPILSDYRAHADLERVAKLRPLPDTICLHQLSALNLKQGIARWRHKEYHWVIELEDATAYLMHDLDKWTWHAGDMNKRSVGIGVEGYYAGIEGDPSTLWRPKGHDDRVPRQFHIGLAVALIMAVKATIDMVAANGGEIKYIGAHRQSSDSRRSDPGSAIWKVARMCMDEFGLQEAATMDPGMDIPDAWSGEDRGVEY
jgi:hypothetical protein